MKSTERRLMDIIWDIYDDAYGSSALNGFEIVVDQVIYCGLDERDELRELGRTRHPFIVEAIVEGGRPTNRYEITIEPVK